MKNEKTKKSQTAKDNLKQGADLKVENKRTGFSNLLGLSLIIFLGIIIYSNSFDCSFHFDDLRNFADNPNIPVLTDFQAWWNYSQTRLVGLYSLALNLHFNQSDVWGYHLVNLIIHLLSACLVWWITIQIFSTPALKAHRIAKHVKLIAFFTALLFVSHPLATQSVTYIVQRLASMAAMFYLLSVALYLKARLSESGNTAKYLLFAGSILSALFAFFTKENTLTLPFAILLVEFFFIRTKKLDINFKDYRLILLVSGLIGFVVWVTLKFSFSVFKPIQPTQLHAYTLTPFNYLLTQFSVIVKYIQLLLLPINQMVDYDFPLSNNLFEIRTLLSFLLLLSLLIVAIYLFQKHRMISFGIFWFFLTLSVESSIIPINDLIFEHRTYLPSFGFFLILSSTVFILLWDKYRLLAIGIFSIIVISNSYLTFERNKVWKNDLSLWNDNVKKAPNLSRPVLSRGNAYANLKAWDKAIVDFTKAISLNPNFASAYCNRGQVYGSLNQWSNAIADYTNAVNIEPNFITAYNNRAVAYENVKQYEKAISDYSMAIKINPKFANAYYNRGIAYGNLQQWSKAIEDYTKVIGIKPNDFKAYYSRAIAYKSLNDLDKAIADYNSAIEINPNFTDAYCNRGIIYGSLKQWDKAISDYSKAIGIDPNHAKTHFNRGGAYATLLKWENAVADFSKAITINPNYTIAYINRGIAYSNLKQWDKSIADYSKAIELDPNNKFVYSQREIAIQKLKID